MGHDLKPRITLVTLGVADIARARAFYERLGLEASSAGNEEVAFFEVNGVVLALWDREALAADALAAAPATGTFSGTALAWNVSSEAEADAVFAHAEAAGARIVKPPHKTFWGGYSGYFADPDGHHWEVAHNPFWPLEQGRVRLP